MMQFRSVCDRRSFLSGALAAGATFSLARLVANEPLQNPYEFCAFIKFIQSLSYDELSARIAALGFNGIEATVRRGGYVLPERVEEELPKLVDALRKHDLEITVMASDVNRVDQPLTEKVLRTAAGLGIKRYRMDNYRYDLNQSVIKQLDEFRPALKELLALNRDVGIRAVYQNHSGARYVGALLWDLYDLIKDYSIEEIGVAFDIRHATVEGGLSWPTHFNLMRSHLGAVYVKDLRWEGRQPLNVPLGEGQVDPQFFKLLRRSDFRGPISVHVEYLQDADAEQNVEALGTDLKTLRQLLTT